MLDMVVSIQMVEVFQRSLFRLLWNVTNKAWHQTSTLATEWRQCSQLGSTIAY